MWNNFFVGLVDAFIAVGVVYFFAWLLNEPADNVVGWVALGMAAGVVAKR
jgi:hypothetical protein